MTMVYSNVTRLLDEQPVYTGVQRSNTRYELPPGRISLLGYAARRLHKTSLLSKALALAGHGQSDAALACIGLYVAGASTSFGVAHYQPESSAVGDGVSESDPATGAGVSVRLLERQPHLRLAAEVRLGDDLALALEERILGTQLSWRGLGMPAPLNGWVSLGVTTVEVRGHLTNELTPGLMQTLIRGHGTVNLSDNLGQQAKVMLERNGRATAIVTRADGGQHRRVAHFAAGE
jgi:hypothetical protein